MNILHVNKVISHHLYAVDTYEVQCTLINLMVHLKILLCLISVLPVIAIFAL